MTKKKLIQIIAIIFLIFAVLLLIPNTKWSENNSVIGFVSLVCGTLGSIISIFIPTSYDFIFNQNNWNYDELEKDYNISIIRKKHGLGKSVTTQIFMENNGSYQEVIADSNHDAQGNVIIKASKPFNGKVIIS